MLFCTERYYARTFVRGFTVIIRLLLLQKEVGVAQQEAARQHKKLENATTLILCQ